LLARLNLKGQPANPLYKLNVTLKESNLNLGVKKTAVVTRGNLKLSTTFTLSKSTNVASKIESRNLMTATVTAISSYDIPQAHYLALIALKDARARAVKETADDIRSRLGIYFHQSSQ
jgi:LPS-assembly lipoprotein